MPTEIRTESRADGQKKMQMGSHTALNIRKDLKTMTTEKSKLRPLPANLIEIDLTGLQNLHSEMLATCSEVGVEPSDETLVEITGVSQGASVVRLLHEEITRFLVSQEQIKKPLADDEGKKETDASAEKLVPKKKTLKKKESSLRPESPQDAMARQKAARLARDAATLKVQLSDTPAVSEQQKKKEKKMAKKAKKSAKKAASSNARTRVDENKKITWLLKDKDLGAREGSERAERRKKLKSAGGKTVGAYLKSGGSVATLNRAVVDKVVKVS